MTVILVPTPLACLIKMLYLILLYSNDGTLCKPLLLYVIFVFRTAQEPRVRQQKRKQNVKNKNKKKSNKSDFERTLEEAFPKLKDCGCNEFSSVPVCLHALLYIHFTDKLARLLFYLKYLAK